MKNVLGKTWRGRPHNLRVSMERQQSAKQWINRPPSAVPVPKTATQNYISRPITQQGLSGLRPQQTPTPGTNRIYRDKRYYMSRIQAHINTIRDEINRLRKNTLDHRVASINRNDMRKTAETTAKNLTEKQDQLNVYNTALDMHLSKTRNEEIAEETSRLRERNETLLRDLDNVFQQKLKKESEIQDIERKVTEEDETMRMLIGKLSPDAQQKYYHLSEENRQTLENIANMQEKIKNSKDLIEQYKGKIANSLLKQKKLQTLRNISRLNGQKGELEAFVQNTLTPAQQREQLLQQVKQDKADIDALLKVKDCVELELASNETRLADLEQELEGKDNARLKKHKELRERGEHMEQFISEYEGKANEIKKKLMDLNCDIAMALEYLADNQAEHNLRDLDVMYDEGGSIEDLNEKYKLLSGQISKLNLVKQKYENEISVMKEKMTKMREELEMYSDVEKGREELLEKRTELMDKQGQLQNTLDSTRSAVIEARKKRDDIKQRIEENEDYNQIMKMESRIDETNRENEELEALVEAELSNAELDSVLEQMENLLAKRNQQLIALLQHKN